MRQSLDPQGQVVPVGSFAQRLRDRHAASGLHLVRWLRGLQGNQEPERMAVDAA